ncbi:hypothetical protein ACFLZS_01610 [Patescibacteria group bacterium]
MEILESLLFLVGGGVLALFFDRLYYKIFEKRSFDRRLKTLIREAEEDKIKKKITIRELNNLIDNKTYDSSSNCPLPYKRCPRCGSQNLNGSMASNEKGNHYFIDCKNCGWEEYTE